MAPGVSGSGYLLAAQFRTTLLVPLPGAAENVTVIFVASTVT